MNNRLIDNPDFLLPKKDQPDECPECGGDGYDTEDGGQCSSCRGTGDSSDCDYDYDYDYDCSEDEDDDLEDEVSNDNSISDKNGQSYIESSHRY
jgi:RecJ-like exonuclease